MLDGWVDGALDGSLDGWVDGALANKNNKRWINSKSKVHHCKETKHDNNKQEKRNQHHG